MVVFWNPEGVATASTIKSSIPELTRHHVQHAALQCGLQYYWFALADAPREIGSILGPSPGQAASQTA